MSRKTAKATAGVTLDVIFSQINEAATDFEAGNVLAGVSVVGNIIQEVAGTLHNTVPAEAPSGGNTVMAACPVPTDCQAAINRCKNSAARCCSGGEGMHASLFGLNIDPAQIQNMIQIIETLLPLFINAAKVAA